jgi:hypothetical protein
LASRTPSAWGAGNLTSLPRCGFWRKCRRAGAHHRPDTEQARKARQRDCGRAGKDITEKPFSVTLTILIALTTPSSRGLIRTVSRVGQSCQDGRLQPRSSCSRRSRMRDQGDRQRRCVHHALKEQAIGCEQMHVEGFAWAGTRTSTMCPTTSCSCTWRKSYKSPSSDAAAWPTKAARWQRW